MNQWYSADAPEVSIIVLNFNNAALTSKCLDHISQNTSGFPYEVLVIDNGSAAEDFAELAKIPGPQRVIGLGANRHFGEGNNIGADHSRGDVLVFLNNDAFVTENWLAPLMAVLTTGHKAGAVGPLFLYPDGRIQEAGAYVDDRGDVVKVGRSVVSPDILEAARVVDYCSAACLAISREVFDQVGGFDPIYEPAYFEDADLCLRIRSTGRHVYCAPKSVVVHIEQATANKYKKSLKFEQLVATNRDKFMSRWGDWLRARGENRLYLPPQAFGSPRFSRAPRGRRKLVLYSPGDLRPDSAHHYLLSAARAVADDHDIYVATDKQFSTYRLASLCRELGIDMIVSPISWSELPRLGLVDMAVVLGNAVVPSHPAIALRNYYICQFPAEIRRETLAAWRPNLTGVNAVVLPSEFAYEAFKRQAAKAEVGSEHGTVIRPAVWSGRLDQATAQDTGPVKILSIAEFRGDGRNRQDVAIHAIRALARSGFKVELHLVGSVGLEARSCEYYQSIKRLAKDLPVALHPDADPALVDRLVRAAAIYLGCIGFGWSQAAELWDPSGAGILNAMAAGCIPVAVAKGAPPEFIRDGENGFLYRTRVELVMKLKRILSDSAALIDLARAAERDAAFFSRERFTSAWRALVAA